MPKDRYYKAALDLANRLRKEKGWEPIDELPKGNKMDIYSCPLARGAGSPISWRYVGSVPRPKLAAEFVRRFDDGKYPWLVE